MPWRLSDSMTHPWKGNPKYIAPFSRRALDHCTLSGSHITHLWSGSELFVTQIDQDFSFFAFAGNFRLSTFFEYWLRGTEWGAMLPHKEQCYFLSVSKIYECANCTVWMFRICEKNGPCLVYFFIFLFFFIKKLVFVTVEFASVKEG